MTEERQASKDLKSLRRQVALLWAGLAVLVAGWITAEVGGLGTESTQPVLRVERLEIVEPNGELAFVLANSQRPTAGTINGQVLMAGQEAERRGRPSIIFFDGQGDEVGGMNFGITDTPNGYQVTRHLSLDAHEHDQTVVLAHRQDPEGSTSGLTISDRPPISILEAFAELGLSPGASRDELNAAVAALPEEGREARMRELFGGTRLFVGATPDGNARLTLFDGSGRPRIVIAAPSTGDPEILLLDESGDPLLSLPE